MNVGIVGLPNVGKSTIFNALSTGGAEAQNYPFCTIDPNVGIVPVNDPRLRKINEIMPAKQVIMTTVEIVDIAGLVKGASSGEGLGNQFLSNIAQTDAILEVVRVFEDEDVPHVMANVDPLRDTEIIKTELILKDIETLTKAGDKIQKRCRSGEKEALTESKWLDEFLEGLNKNITLRQLKLSEEKELFAKSLNVLTQKPILYVANVNENDILNYDHPSIKALSSVARDEGSSVILISGKIEEEISRLSDDEKEEYLATIGLNESGLDRLVHEGYQLLDLITFFTSGPKENRAWTIRKGASAPQAAGKIHSDFERGFIRAEVISFDDFVTHGGELGAKAVGKLRVEGKEYVVSDGDLMHFRFNV